MHVDAGDVEARELGGAGIDLARAADRNAELVLGLAGRDLGVRLGIDVGIDAHRDADVAALAGRDRRQQLELGSDSTLTQRMPSSTASASSRAVLPMPENMILSGGMPAARARLSSPSDTTSAPAPSAPASRSPPGWNSPSWRSRRAPARRRRPRRTPGSDAPASRSNSNRTACRPPRRDRRDRPPRRAARRRDRRNGAWRGPAWAQSMSQSIGVRRFVAGGGVRAGRVSGGDPRLRRGCWLLDNVAAGRRVEPALAPAAGKAERGDEHADDGNPRGGCGRTIALPETPLESASPYQIGRRRRQHGRISRSRAGPGYYPRSLLRPLPGPFPSALSHLRASRARSSARCRRSSRGSSPNGRPRARRTRPR